MTNSPQKNFSPGLASPKDVFLHLAMVAALYISVFSFITLLFQYINVLFPDQLNFYIRGILNSISWSTAALVIVFPVFLSASWFIEKEFVKHPDKREFLIRKWLLYLTLFIASVAVTIDLVALVFNFLSGELTMRFLLKVIVIFGIAGGVFWYYLWNLRNGGGEVARKLSKKIAIGVSLFVVVAIVSGFFIVGTPAHQRRVRFDEKRVSNLQIIQNHIVNYWREKGELPEKLENLEDSISGFTPPLDPRTTEPYKYKVLELFTFELCAVFETSSNVSLRSVVNVEPIALGPRGFEGNWEHSEGETCFERTIDPDLYGDDSFPIPIKERLIR